MFGQFAHSSWFGALTTIAFVLHIAGGTVGLVAGTVALFSRKGGWLHRTAGTVFFISMLVMAVFAIYLSIVRPGQLFNLFGGTFAFYLVATGWMAIRNNAGTVGSGEKVAFAAALLLCAPFLLLSFELATGLPPFFNSATPLKGPVLIALYVFTAVTVTAALGDAKVILAGGISGTPRIARHLWRMCLGLTMAAGSAFTNGLPRLLPAPMHVTGIYFLPQLVPLVLMFFWLIRVRFSGRFKPRAIVQSA
jgi:uncharacterized membrane protein